MDRELNGGRLRFPLRIRWFILPPMLSTQLDCLRGASETLAPRRNRSQRELGLPIFPLTDSLCRNKLSLSPPTGSTFPAHSSCPKILDPEKGVPAFSSFTAVRCAKCCSAGIICITTQIPTR